MKGLVTKDFCLMLQRKRSYIIILLCALLMSFSTEGSFIVGWMIMIGSLFSLSTIAYDEYDNGYPFLMTMPVTRKCYVCEKYLFGMICSLMFSVLGVVFYGISSAVRGVTFNFAGEITELLILLLAPLLILDVSIPFSLKYGSEKGRIYMLVLWGALFAAGFLLYKYVLKNGTGTGVVSLYENALLAVLACITVAVTAASVLWSVRIMEKKEF